MRKVQRVSFRPDYPNPSPFRRRARNKGWICIPRLMEKKDCLQTMAEVGSAGSVSQQMTAGKSLVRIGSKKGVWRIPTEEEDRAMDEEIAALFDLDEVLM